MNFWLISLTFLIVIGPSKGATYGEDCDENKGVYCYDGSWCIDYKCQCPSGSTYFPDFDQCALRVGDTCKEDSEWPYFCVSGSVCNAKSQICTCEDPSYPLPDGSCSRNLGYPCGCDQECTKGQHTSCIDGRCQCSDPVNYFIQYNYYQYPYEECRVVANGKCGEGNYPKCGNDADCVDGVCRCRGGTSATHYGNCLKNRGEDCDPHYYDPNEIGCNFEASLICQNGRCECIDFNQVWNDEEKKCGYEVGAPCQSTTYYSPYVDYDSCADPNATCGTLNFSKERPKCHCNEGFTRYKGCCVPVPDPCCSGKNSTISAY